MSNMIILGAGDLWAKASTANATPVRIATAKKISVSITKESIDLTGAYEFPLDTAGGKATCKGKITIAGFETNLVAAALPGAVSSVGYSEMYVDEAGTIPTTPFQITVAHVTGGITDFGVLLTTTNAPLTKVASSPAANQYSVVEATGVYTFNTADAGKAVKISYANAVTGSGITVDVKSALIGSAPSYMLQGWNTYSGQKIGYRFPTVKFTGPSFEFSTEQHTQPEYDFSATALPGASTGPPSSATTTSWSAR